jgi:hypothetical protein
MASTTTTMMTIQSQVGMWILPFAECLPDLTTRERHAQPLAGSDRLDFERGRIAS